MVFFSLNLLTFLALYSEYVLSRLCVLWLDSNLDEFLLFLKTITHLIKRRALFIPQRNKDSVFSFLECGRQPIDFGTC